MEPCLQPKRPTPPTNITPLNLYPRLESLELLKTINYGITSKVKLGRDTITNQEYAVKIIRPEFQTRYLNALEQEAKFLPILSQEQHPNIIKLIEYRPNAEYTKKNGEKRHVFALIFELAQGGDLFECIKAIGDFQENVARTYFQQLITTVEYLHDKNIVHGYLKLENLLLGVDFSLKIADFSFASSSLEGIETLSHRQRLGLTPYMAPELLTDPDCVSSSTDLFSCGVILFLMVVGQPPFDKACVQDFKYRLIIKHQFEAFWKQFDLKNRSISESFKDLVVTMLAYEPSQRLSIPEIKAHPWYKGKICSLEELKKEYEVNKQSFIAWQEEKDREMKRMKEIKAFSKKEVNNISLEKPKPSHFSMKGITPFSHRSLSVAIDRQMEDDLHSPELNVDRIIRKYVFTGYKQISEQFYRINQKNMFKLALLLSNSLFSSFKVHPAEYKIKGSGLSENNSDFSGEILFSITHVDDNSCCISITKVKGPLLPFYKFIEEKFKVGVDKALEKFVENNFS